MRQARIKVENGKTAVYHCVTRVVGSAMLLDKHAREVLRKQMRYMADFCGVELITYCILKNHFHVLIRIPGEQVFPDSELLRRFKLLYEKDVKKIEELEEVLKQGGKEARKEREKLLRRMGDVSHFLKELKQRFSIWYNKKHGRFGTLWAERFRSLLLEDSPEAVSCVAAYIDLNPVRAGIVADPKDYRWCGYAEAASGDLVFRGSLARMFEDKTSMQGVMAEYRKLLFIKGSSVEQEDQSKVREELVEEVLNQEGRLSQAQVLRLKVRYFSDGAVLGSKEFVNEYFQQHQERFGNKRKTGARPMMGFENSGLSILGILRNAVFS